MDQSLSRSSTTNTAIDPNDLPAGFSLQDPNNHGGNSTSNNNNNTNSAAANASAMQQQKQSILEQVMEPDALARLRRIQLVKPQKATMLENAIIQLATTNKLTEPITDGKFVEMLERQLAQEHRRNDTINDNNDTTTTTTGLSSSSHINSSSSSGISIRRKKYAIDSDDDDDNDDDLL